MQLLMQITIANRTHREVPKSYRMAVLSNDVTSSVLALSADRFRTLRDETGCWERSAGSRDIRKLFRMRARTRNVACE